MSSMTFKDLEHEVHEGIIVTTVDATEIEAKVTALLKPLQDDDDIIVRQLARQIADGISFELAFKDGDMESVICRLNAVLEPTLEWLKSRGVDVQTYQPVLTAKVLSEVERVKKLVNH